MELLKGNVMTTKLDKTEKKLLRDFRAGRLRSVEDLDSEKKRYQKLAANTLRRDKRVNIRVSQDDIEALRERAQLEGIPYQTLIYSIIRKYLGGRLLDRKT